MHRSDVNVYRLQCRTTFEQDLTFHLINYTSPRTYPIVFQLEPDNVQGLHNLCVVMVEAGDLTQAQACLQEAKRLAPEEEYIGRHLSIVEQRIEEMGADLASH